MTRILLTEGLNQLIVGEHTLSPIQIETSPKGTYQLVLNYQSKEMIDIKVMVRPDANLSVFISSDADQIHCVERYEVYRSAQLNLAYADLSNSKIKRVSSIHLIEEGAGVDLHSVALVNQDHEVQYIFEHEAEHTTGSMENYAVIVEQGLLKLHAIGHIHKSAYFSETHQSTRVLSLANAQKAVLYPQLIIDNNEVLASHSASTGQLDDEHLYYLESRGLNKQAAIRLVVQGYLSSIADHIVDEGIKQSILSMIERKVTQYV